MKNLLFIVYTSLLLTSFYPTEVRAASNPPASAATVALDHFILAGDLSSEQAAFTLTASGPGRRLVRWHVFAPDGAFLPEYAGHVVAEGPRASFVLPSALSDPPGDYRLEATDVLSGARAEAMLRLK